MKEKLSLIRKIQTDRNPKFFPDVRKLLEDFKNGDVISICVYAKHSDGSVSTMRSYSNSPAQDAGELLSMALHRMGFVRKD